MNTPQEQEVWKQHLHKAFTKIEGVRHYALDPASELCLISTCQAWQEQRASEGKGFDIGALTPFLESLVVFAPELVQSKPGAVEPIPEIPRDPVTGEACVNPWITVDLESQGVCEERLPTLAAHLKRVAKSKGFSFAHWSEIEDAAATRATAENISYDEKSHESNPYRQPNRTLQGQFERDNAPETVAFFRREAQPLRLPWQRGHTNLTKLGQLHKNAPELAKIISRGQQIETEAVEGQLAIAKENELVARQQLQQAERLLQGQPA